MQEDFEKEQRAAAKASKEFEEAMVRLERNADWLLYQGHLQGRANALANGLLEPLGGEYASERQEYNKGTVKGLILATTLPATIVSAGAASATDLEATATEDDEA